MKNLHITTLLIVTVNILFTDMESFVSQTFTTTTYSILRLESFYNLSTPMMEAKDDENVTDIEHLFSDYNDTSVKSDCLHHIEHNQSPLAFYAVFSAIFFLGIVGNGMLIVIFLCHKSMRTAPNTYIFNLAIADLLTTLSCASAPLLAGAGRSFPNLCRTFQLFLEISMGVTSFTLVALSVERYYAIVHPLRRKISSKQFTISIVALTWLVSTSYVVEKMVFLKRGDGPQCVQMFNPSSFATTYKLIDFVAFYFIPLVIISSFYLLMAFELYYSHSFIQKDAINGDLPKHIQVRKRIAFTVLILAAMFAIFYFPFNFLSLRLYFDSEYVKHWDTSINILFCVGCLHNCLNPYILYSLSKSFRDHFNKYLFYFRFRSAVQVSNEHPCECSECTKKTNSCNTSSIKTLKV